VKIPQPIFFLKTRIHIQKVCVNDQGNGIGYSVDTLEQ